VEIETHDKGGGGKHETPAAWQPFPITYRTLFHNIFTSSKTRVLSYRLVKTASSCVCLSKLYYNVTDRQTDRQTDRERQTVRGIQYLLPRLAERTRGKKGPNCEH